MEDIPIYVFTFLITSYPSEICITAVSKFREGFCAYLKKIELTLFIHIVYEAVFWFKDFIIDQTLLQLRGISYYPKLIGHISA